MHCTRPLPVKVQHAYGLLASVRSLKQSPAACKAVPQVQLSQPVQAADPPPPAAGIHPLQEDAAATPSPVLLLGLLDQPQSLQTAWQQDILPACLDAWGRLLQQARQLQEHVAQQVGAAEQRLLLEQAGEVLLQLDALLGTCQQVLVLASHLKDHHCIQQWRTAAAQVFVKARSLEQEVCSDVMLQQAVWACLALLQEAHDQQQQPQQHGLSATPHSTLQHQQPEGHNAGADSTAKLAVLARRLLRHLQLDSQSPAVLADPSRRQQQQQAQVLSLQEQQAMLSGLLAEQKVLVNNMQALLLDPTAAPLVELDPDSKQVLLQPLLQASSSAAALAPTAAVAVASSPAEGSEAPNVVGSGNDNSEATTSELRLDLGLVSQLLQLHIDAAVRQEVYSAGLLQQLEVLLSLWGDLAEVRRKIGSMHGCDSYADYVLQHSLLGSSQAAHAFCKRLAAELQPAAAQAVDSWQQAQGQPQVQEQQELSGGDVPRCARQELQGLLSPQDLQDLQPYLQLPGVLAGFDTVLQQLLGLHLVPLPLLPGEGWAGGLTVLELWMDLPRGSADISSSSSSDSDSGEPSDSSTSSSSSSVRSSSKQQHAASSSSNVASGDLSAGHAGGLLGTIYIDPNAGYAAQLLQYGGRYPLLGAQKLLDLLPPQQTSGNCNSSSSSGSSSGRGSAVTAAVALGVQSGGVLCGSYDHLGLGLWELCHELGHAVNFILSSCSPSGQLQHHADGSTACGSSSSSGSSSSRGLNRAAAQDGPEAEASGQPAASASARGRGVYHLHDAWQPVELLELPSTLLEALVMDAAALQLLCRHQDTGEQLPGRLASKLAAFMRSAHYNPALYQQQALAMLYDLEMAALSSRQLGQHAAHHLWSCIMQELSVMPGVVVTLQQVSCIPRLLSLSGQGYGYAVARSLACLLQPLLLQHTSSGTESLGEGANRESMLGGQRQWRQVFGAGAELQDIGVLINTVVQLEKEAGSAGVQQRTLQEVLQEQEQWPFVGDRAGQQGLLAACLLHCIKRLVTTL